MSGGGLREEGGGGKAPLPVGEVLFDREQVL